MNLERIGWRFTSIGTERGFFDGYGQPPEQYRDSFGDFLEPYEWQFNMRRLQSTCRMCVANIAYFTLATEHKA